MKEPIRHGAFWLQVHLDGHCWVAPGGVNIWNRSLAETMAEYYGRRMG